MCLVSSVPQMIIKTLFTITVKPKCLIRLFDYEPMDFRFSYNNSKRTFTSYSFLFTLSPNSIHSAYPTFTIRIDKNIGKAK